MPFRVVPCKIWLPIYGQADEWGNSNPSYAVEADIDTVCCYSPGTQRADTDDDIEQDRPYGAVASMTFYLPKIVDTDLRGARIACYPKDDTMLSGKLWDVVGEPFSYSRANTPGDYSWAIEGVRHIG